MAIFSLTVDTERAARQAKVKTVVKAKIPTYAVGEEVWAKVVYKGKQVVIKTTVESQRGKNITVKSKTTKALYPVTVSDVYTHRPQI